MVSPLTGDGSDIILSSTQVVFSAEDTEKTVGVFIRSDSVSESSETFTVTMARVLAGMLPKGWSIGRNNIEVTINANN